MTHSGGKPHAVGDKGQRYEVSTFDEDKGQRIVIGWTNDYVDAFKMQAACDRRPGWSKSEVKDRQP